MGDRVEKYLKDNKMYTPKNYRSAYRAVKNKALKIKNGADYQSLLAEGYAYRKKDGALLKLSEMKENTAVTVVKCSHPEDPSGGTVCPYCGCAAEVTKPDGSILGQQVTSVDAGGLYVPGGQGGNTPLVSSLLMSAIPAQVAGVPRLAVFTPPRKDGTVNPHILAAAHLLDIDEVYRVGGAWSIAAMAYGLDLDDLGTQVGQHQAAAGAHDHMGEFHHAHTGIGQRGGGFRG